MSCMVPESANKCGFNINFANSAYTLRIPPTVADSATTQFSESIEKKLDETSDGPPKEDLNSAPDFNCFYTLFFSM